MQRIRPDLFFTVLVSAGLLFQGGCTGKKDKKTGSATVAIDLALVQSTAATLLLTDAGSDSFFKSFTPESFKVPITRIDVGGEGVSGNVYTCPGTTADACMVDLADKDAVAALSASATISLPASEDTPTGTITYIGVNQGFDNGVAGSRQIKGSASINGTTYYTTATGSNILSELAADYGTTTVALGAGYRPFYLPTPATVKDGDSMTASVFFSIDLAANMGLVGREEDCASANGKSVCFDPSGPVAYMGKDEPTVETYKITSTANQAQAVLYLLVDQQDKPIGGFFRPLYDGTKQALTQGIYNLRDAVDNGDGTYTINTLGNGGTDSVPLFKTFKRSAHSGEISWINENLAYNAIKL